MIFNIEPVIYIGLFLSLYFGIFVFFTFFENRKEIYRKIKNKKHPLITLIIPCYNEEDNVEMVLNSVLSLDYPKERLEIILVDDGSTDKTLEKAKLFSGIKIFHKENGGKYSALNLGVKKARGDLIGCVDADCTVKKDALKHVVDQFENTDADIVISTIKLMPPTNILEGIQYTEFLISAFLKKIFSHLGSITVTPGPLSLFKKQTLAKLGPYKEAHMTEDLEMAFRAQTKHLKIAHALNAIIYTKGQKTLKTLCQQRLRWRRGFLLNLKDYPSLFNMKEHGNLSLCLFYNIFGALLSISLIFYALFRFFSAVITRVNHAFLINFDFWPYLSLARPHFNFKPAFVLGLVALLALVLFLLMGKRLTFDKIKLKKKALFYILGYSFLNTAWWLLASFSIILKKKIIWK